VMSAIFSVIFPKPSIRKCDGVQNVDL